MNTGLILLQDILLAMQCSVKGKKCQLLAMARCQKLLDTTLYLRIELAPKVRIFQILIDTF